MTYVITFLKFPMLSYLNIKRERTLTMNYLTSIFTGTLLAIMVLFNGALGESMGNYASSVMIHFIGLIGIILLLIGTKSKLNHLKGVPLYMYSAGLIGIITVLFSNMSYAHLGVALTVALGLLGQSITSIVVDHFGLFGIPANPFNQKKLIGLLLIALGIVAMTIL